MNSLINQAVFVPKISLFLNEQSQTAKLDLFESVFRQRSISPLFKFMLEQRLPHNICDLHNQHHAPTFVIPHFFIIVLKCQLTFASVPYIHRLSLYSFQSKSDTLKTSRRRFHWKVWSIIAHKIYLLTGTVLEFVGFCACCIIALTFQKGQHERMFYLYDDN